MFKNNKTFNVLLLGAGLALSSLAYSGDAYIGATVSFFDYDETVVIPGFDPLEFDGDARSLNIRLGKNYTDNFAAELRLGVGMGDDSVTTEAVDTGVSLEMRDLYGAYFRGGARLAERFYPYIVVGYSQATLEFLSPDLEVDGDYAGVSYGLGADIDFSRDVIGSIEYMHYFDTAGVELAGFSIGLSKLF